jgi:hypothetical protein
MGRTWLGSIVALGLVGLGWAAAGAQRSEPDFVPRVGGWLAP